MESSTATLVRTVKAFFLSLNKKQSIPKANDDDLIDCGEEIIPDALTAEGNRLMEDILYGSGTNNDSIHEFSSTTSNATTEKGLFDDLLFYPTHDLSDSKDNKNKINNIESFRRVSESVNDLEEDLETKSNDSEPWKHISESVDELKEGLFSYEKSLIRRSHLTKPSTFNDMLTSEIDLLIPTLIDIKNASPLIPQTCQEVLFKEIRCMLRKLDLTDVTEGGRWNILDELSSSIITMELMSARNEIENIKSQLNIERQCKLKAIQHNNTRRDRAMFSSYGYEKILSLLERQTHSLIRFIETSPAYDIEYSSFGAKTISAIKDRFPTLRDLAQASYCDLISISGVGEATIGKIKNAFDELNLPTVFIHDRTMNERCIFEQTLNEYMIKKEGFKVPYAICGKRGSEYKPVAFKHYSNFELFEKFDGEGNPIRNTGAGKAEHSSLAESSESH